MRNFILLVTCHLLLVTTGPTQWLEATIPVGNYPWVLVYNSTNNKIYCANDGSNDLTVIDKYNSVITTIPVGDEPWALVYNPLNNKVYCAKHWANNVIVINGATDSVITTINVGTDPWALGYNSLNNKVYCANWSSNNITVIDGASDSVITTVPVGINPRVFVYNSINNKVYCAIQGSDNVSVIDGRTDSVIKTIAVGGGPLAFAWNPTENRTYVANYWSNTVSVIKDTIIVGIAEENSKVKMQSVKLLEVYSNPAKSFLAIRIPSTADRQELKIFDVSGKLVKVADEVIRLRRTKSHKQEVRISLKGLKPGIYFLQLGTEVKKFLVIK